MKLYIDGLEVDAGEGQTIFEAAQDAGIEIPTLCHSPGWIRSVSVDFALWTSASASRWRPVYVLARRAWKYRPRRVSSKHTVRC